jgi:hypothetical protein
MVHLWVMSIKIPEHVTSWLEELQLAAYQRGWDEATAAFQRAAASMRPTGPATSNEVKGSAEQTAIVRRRRATVPSEVSSGSTARERILAALLERPGMRPVEVVAFLKQFDPSLKDQTVLTAIKRLRHSHGLEYRGGGLHIPQQESGKAA